MASGSISKEFYTSSPKYKLIVDWSSASTTSSNSSIVTAKISLYCPYALNIGARADNTIVINGTTYKYNAPAISTSGEVTIALATVKSNAITHNTDGKKSITITCNYNLNASLGSAGTWYGTITASDTAVLDNIPRYATANQSLKSKTETSITMDWSSDSTCDYIWYSKDNGSTWTGIDIADGESGTYTISGLSANTSYNIKTRVRRKDSQLTTNSSALSVATYNYPHCTDTPNFTIGDALTLKFYNPLGRTITVNGYGADGSNIFGGSGNGTSLSGFNDSGSVNKQYASIPNSQSGTYKVVVSYNGVDMTREAGNTYKIRGTEVPTINAFDYIDSNSETVAITGNQTHIVQNKSVLQARFHQATANYGAGSISKYTIEVNGKKSERTTYGAFDMGTIDSSRDVDLILTATDSRGLSTSAKKTVKIISYGNPTATVSLKRLNNYEDETYLTVDGSVSDINGNNTMVIKYRYKLSGGSYGSYTTIGDKVKQTLSLSKENQYIFNVVITDALGSTYNNEFVLGKGVFPLFIDTSLNSVGINCFPARKQSLEVKGDFVCENSFVHNANAGQGSTGYIKWAEIKIGATYQNQPIEFRLCRRGDDRYSTITLKYRNENSLDPQLQTFTTSNTNTSVYICRLEEGLWGLYVHKSEGYDDVCIAEFHKGSYMATTQVSFLSEYIATLPTGNVRAVAEN